MTKGCMKDMKKKVLAFAAAAVLMAYDALSPALSAVAGTL